MSDNRALVGAFVLHRRDYGNTSLLLDVFSSGLGRFPAIARGARRPRSMASALLQPFQPLLLGVVGRGEVRTLTAVEPAGQPATLAGRTLPCGLYLNELLVRLVPRNDPHDPLFALYHAALDGLASGADIDWTLRQFELHLLRELGYAPPLDRRAGHAEPVAADEEYLVEPGQAPRLAQPGLPGIRVRGETLIALARGAPLKVAARGEARALLRGLLEPHLGSKPLKSRELFRHAVRRESSAASQSSQSTRR